MPKKLKLSEILEVLAEEQKEQNKNTGSSQEESTWDACVESMIENLTDKFTKAVNNGELQNEH